ncbi:hypothetical protein C0585_04340 [Candidatus Woesearchaeota archaeon]|nr:MAG: hypothetical protein C0585_04340 [Candidatus Woesearchaeota archaeon]
MKQGVILMMLLLLSSVFVMAADTPIIKLSISKTDPLTISSGDYFDLYIKVDNIGSEDASDVEIEFIDNYPFTVENGKIESIGILGTNKDYIFTYKVRVDENAIEGINTLKLKHTTDGMIYGEKEFDVTVEDDKANLVIGSVESSPLNLIADIDDAEITVNIQNVGESKAKLVSAQIILPEGMESSSSFSDQDTIASIDAEDSQDATFHIDIDKSVAEGVYTGKLILKYKEDKEDEYVTKELDLRLPVKATPIFDIESVEYDKEILKQGDLVSMIVSIKNVGGEDAESVSLRAFQSVGLPIEFDEKSSFIGTIKSGEVGQASLKFTIDDDATPKDYLLDLEIRAVASDEVLVFDKTTNFSIQEGNKGNTTNIIVALIIIAAIVLGIYFFKKK